jgi:hypothetical protein
MLIYPASVCAVVLTVVLVKYSRPAQELMSDTDIEGSKLDGA